MNTKIIFSLLILSTTVFLSCKKVNEAKGIKDVKEVNAVSSEESELNASVLTEARTNLKTVVPENTYNDLDWNNAVVKTQDNDGRIAIIKSRKNASDSLVYLTACNIRMYQWAGEVHSLLIK
jgi:hypothetical protein